MRSSVGAVGAVAQAIFANYQHVARCTDCRDYARWHEEESPGVALAATTLAAATLAHHAGAHRRDPLTLASQHFA